MVVRRILNSYAFLKLKNTYPYIFSHKPLCKEFENHSFKIFHVFLCKSCSLIVLGVISGIILGFFESMNKLFIQLDYFLLFGSLLIVFLSTPFFYYKFNRSIKNHIRFIMGNLIAISLIEGFSLNPFALGALFFLFIYSQVNKKGRDQRYLKVCETCDESNQGVCSGFKKQVDGFRKFENDYYEKVLVHKRPKVVGAYK